MKNPNPHNESADQLRDAQLLQRMREGNDERALVELMDIHAERLVTIAEISIGSRALALEAANDAFVQAWENRHRLKAETRILGYLITATRNRALDIIRHERMHERISYNVAQDYDAAVNEGELNIEYAEAKDVVQQALAELPPRCREIFLLHTEAGLSVGDIENTLGVSQASIRNQISRASTHLMAALSRWMKG